MRRSPFPRLCAASFAVLFSALVTAAPLACPDLRDAKAVGTCPSDEELRYTFIGFCSDNARLYDGKGEVCDDFAAYRRLKNVALWESADGAFDAYPSCELAPAAIRGAKPARIAVAKRGRLTEVVCDYGAGVRFTHRTRADCRVDGGGRCDTPEGCRAVCD